MEQVLSYTLVSASVLLVCKKAHELFKSILEKCVQMEVKCNRKHFEKEMFAQYEEIKNYSICLSIDYEKNKKYKDNIKEVLNKTIYSKIEDVLKKKFNVTTKRLDNVLIVMSGDFSSYDRVYDNILETLSKIRSEILKRYSLVLIPSIITDAHTGYPNVNNIAHNHNNVKHCNFNNKSCATKTFSRKYKLMNNYKYTGTPIGEYSIIDDNKEKTYSLNMINNNLSSMLERMG